MADNPTYTDAERTHLRAFLRLAQVSTGHSGTIWIQYCQVFPREYLDSLMLVHATIIGNTAQRELYVAPDMSTWTVVPPWGNRAAIKRELKADLRKSGFVVLAESVNWYAGQSAEIARQLAIMRAAEAFLTPPDPNKGLFED